MSDAPPSVTQNGATQVEEAPGHKVFTGNLAYSTNESGLKELFQPFASDVVSVQVIHRGSRSAGYGFVAFSSLEAAEKAVTALNKKEFEGRTIIVEIAKPTEQKDKDRSQKRTKRRVGRRGAKAPPGEVTEAEANGDSDKPEGAAAPADTTESTKPRKRRFFRRNTRKGTKDSATGDDAPATSPTNNGEDAGPRKAPRQPRRRPTRASGEPPVGEPSTSVLFVANLGFDVDDEGLSTIFTSNGINVISAHVVKRRWGKPRKSKGYGFVDVGSEEEQKKAMAALQGKEFNGREVAVKIAVNAQDKEDDKEDDAEGEKVEKVENGDATA